MRLKIDTPFLLAELPDGSARLYQHAIEIIQTSEGDQVRPALQRARAALRAGHHVAGFLCYEAGAVLQSKDIVSQPHALPLVWFGVFPSPRRCSTQDLATMFPETQSAGTSCLRFDCTEAEYQAMFHRVRDLIRAGDIYQANLTVRASVSFVSAPTQIYAAIRHRARARHAAMIWTGSDWILSFSPESFFELRGRRVIARPMKGTAARGRDIAADEAAIEQLRSDPKERAENLMIVDLMRNDLARLSRPGSVHVPHLFEVETYPTVHQMISTVCAEVHQDVDAIDILETAFPAGSITGAPKIRAMEVIAALEPQPRGLYCGSIGWMDPGGDASFNVAIRTIHIDRSGHHGRLGLGSGIVADSDASREWRECQTKGLFLCGT